MLPPLPRSTLFPYTTLFRSYPPRHFGSSAIAGVTPFARFPLRFNASRASCTDGHAGEADGDRKSTRLNSSHQIISYAVFCLKKKMKSSYHLRSKVEVLHPST